MGLSCLPIQGVRAEGAAAGQEPLLYASRQGDTSYRPADTRSTLRNAAGRRATAFAPHVRIWVECTTAQRIGKTNMGGAWMGLAAVGRWWRVSCSAPIRPANYSMGCGPRYHALSPRPSPPPRAGSAAQRVPARFSVFDFRYPGVQTRGSGDATIKTFQKRTAMGSNHMFGCGGAASPQVTLHRNKMYIKAQLNVRRRTL